MNMELNEKHRPKGSLILITIFFVTFVLFYLLNWRYLLDIWKVG